MVGRLYYKASSEQIVPSARIQILKLQICRHRFFGTPSKLMLMRTEDNDKKNKQQRTPIIDGDARPDLDVSAEQKKDHPVKTPHDTTKGVTTKNRKDKNSLEDYKDGRLE